MGPDRHWMYPRLRSSRLISEALSWLKKGCTGPEDLPANCVALGRAQMLKGNRTDGVTKRKQFKARFRPIGILSCVLPPGREYQGGATTTRRGSGVPRWRG